MLRLNLSETALLTLVVPGAVLLFALVMFGWPWLQPYGNTAFDAIRSIRSGQNVDMAIMITAALAVLAIAAYVLSLLLGTLLGVVIAYFEAKVLDPHAARELGITDEEYWQDWCRYVDHLDEHKNSYISKTVASFLFESRASLASLIAAGLLPYSSAPLFVAAVVWSLGVMVGIAGIHDHESLAEYRHRRFGKTGRLPGDAEGEVRKLLSGWLNREELDPLRKLLPAWPLPDTTPGSLTRLVESLQQIADLPPAIVTPVEKDKLGRAISLLKERLPPDSTVQSEEG
jgi:hypothetical protein